MDTVEMTMIVPSQLRMAVMRLARRLRQESVGDITQSQLSALSIVDRRGPLSLGELADIERVAPPSMTRIAARLEERGWVVRAVDSMDRRVARLEVTDAGRALLKETRTRRDAYLATRLRGLSAEERDILLSALPLLERLAGDE
ncbi:MAG TPA: MarR family transcriptional regulator [Acidimicrobiales bacterium]|nr:MarR family transcriptional regulator [Acidimicrobiales bacterium]